MGFFMRRYDFPIAPVILGVILGPLMETQARRALTASGDDFGVFFGRPLTVILLLVAVAAFVVPHLGALRGPLVLRRGLSRGSQPILRISSEASLTGRADAGPCLRRPMTACASAAALAGACPHPPPPRARWRCSCSRAR